MRCRSLQAEADACGDRPLLSLGFGRARDVGKTLYPHQVDGAMWLAWRERAGLFDQQGLGKTLTALEASRYVKAESMLVICPSIAAWNWAAEIEEHSGRSAYVVDSSAKARKSRDHDVVCTTHGLMIRDAMRSEILRRKWDVIVLDESHEFCSPDTLRAQMFYGSGRRSEDDFPTIVERGRFVWCLTGTPAPSNRSQLWTFLDGMFPDLIEDRGYWAFAKRFCRVWKGRFGLQIEGSRNSEELRAIGKVAWLRRLKKDHLKSLPPMRFEAVRLRPKSLPRELKSYASKLGVKLDTKDNEAALRAIRAEESGGKFRRLCGVTKIAPTIEWIEREFGGGLECLIVFAWHKEVVEGVAAGLRAAGKRVGVVVGGMSAKKKHAVTEAFQAGELDVICANIQAGGTAATWTRASELVFVELDYVPGKNAQAADRIHRMSQKSKKVRARIISLAGTLDDAIQDTLRKRTRDLRDLLDKKDDER